MSLHPTIPMARINRTAPVGSRALSLGEARRIALRAQGFGATFNDGKPNRAAMLRSIKQIGLLQLDSVNVLVRSHYLPLFSRLGPYDAAALDALVAAHAARAV